MVNDNIETGNEQPNRNMMPVYEHGTAGPEGPEMELESLDGKDDVNDVDQTHTEK